MSRQWIKGVGGAVIAMAPMVVPHWIDAIAEEYGEPTAPTVPGIDSGNITPSENAATTFVAVRDTCVTGDNGRGSEANQRFQNDCDLLIGGMSTDLDNAVDAFNQLAADQVAAKNAAAQRQFRSGVLTLTNRLNTARLASLSPSLDDAVAWSMRRESGGGASGDLTAGRLGGFFNLKYRTGDQDASTREAGFDFDGWGATAGVDYRFNDNMVAGVALNYMSDEADYEQNRGDMETETWGLNAYGTFYIDDSFYIDGLIGYNSNDYSLNRNIVYTIDGSQANQVASSDPDGEMFSFSIGGGYNMAQGGMTITPTVRLDYLSNKVDGFDENMSAPTGVGGAMSLSMDSVTYKSLTTHLGGQVSKAISYSSGVVVPQLSVNWVHEFENDSKSVGARFINDINRTPFFILTDNGDTDYFDVNLSVSGQFAGGKSAFLSYNTLLGFNRVTYHGINAGVRLEF